MLGGMEPYPILALMVLAIIFVAGIVVVAMWRRTGQPSQTDWRTFFYVGVFMLVASAVSMVLGAVAGWSWEASMPLVTIGIIYVALGWNHRATWRHR